MIGLIMVEILSNAPLHSGLFYMWKKVMTVTEKDREVLTRTLWARLVAKELQGRSPWSGRSATACSMARTSHGGGDFGTNPGDRLIRRPAPAHTIVQINYE
jgi:hypothetical protein